MSEEMETEIKQLLEVTPSQIMKYKKLREPFEKIIIEVSKGYYNKENVMQLSISDMVKLEPYFLKKFTTH